MKAANLSAALVCVVLFHVAAPGMLAEDTPSVDKVSEAEAARWLRWVIPLPKEIAITGKVSLPADNVKITLREGAGDVEKTAAQELASLFKDKAGADVAEGRFEILIGVCDDHGKIADLTIPDASRLKDLPNPEQAYVIRPVGEKGLVLTALDERGVYYAGQTLRQLLEGTFSDGKVTIPLATVTDWPDLAERGEWGALDWFPPEEIEWLARHKMNLVEYHVPTKVTKDGAVVKASADRIEHGRRRAFKMIPIISHLMSLGPRSGMYEAYPELEGQGDGANGCPCASQPKLADVLAQIMCSMARQGAGDISGWLSEGTQHQCGCQMCQEAGKRSQYMLEARAYVKAWRLARKKYPKLGMRVLLSQGSHSTNDKVIAELPDEVGVTYYSSGRTYNSRRDPMIYPLLEDFAKAGGWLGVYPQLTPSFAAVIPWSGGQFIRYRMNEFVDKKLSCLCGYAPYSNRLYRFNITAATEWSWNAKGRDAHEFAAAYATRRGMSDPEAFAEWAVMIGEVGWHIFGADIPYRFIDGRISKLIADWDAPRMSKKSGGRQGMFREYASPEAIDEDLATCAKAMRIAQSLDSADMIAETGVIHGYTKMVKEIHTIAAIIARQRTPQGVDRSALQRAMTDLAKAGWQTTQHLQEWFDLIGLEDVPGRFTETINVKDRTVVAIGDTLHSLFGVSNPMKPYVRKPIAHWTTDDFAEEQRITKRWDVTDSIPVTGTCQVQFRYSGGQWGLTVYRVALASAPVDKREELTELSVDEHGGSTGHQQRNSDYALTIEKRRPDRRYFVVADVQGVGPDDRPDKPKGCNGTVWMVSPLPEDFRPEDWDRGPAAPAIRPFTEQELSLLEPAKIGGWTTQDFAEGREVTMKWDVTEQMSAAGTYGVKFQYAGGHHGAYVHRVALAHAPADGQDKLTELSVDEHDSVMGHVPRSSLYTVTLSERRPDGRYFILADMEGVGPNDLPDKPKGCSGRVWMRRRLIGN